MLTGAAVLVVQGAGVSLLMGRDNAQGNPRASASRQSQVLEVSVQGPGAHEAQCGTVGQVPDTADCRCPVAFVSPLGHAVSSQGNWLSGARCLRASGGLLVC